MGKWNTISFIRAFIHDQLNRKRVHGTYRVLEGGHCKLLVKSSTEYGRPAGNNLIAIRLDSDDLNMFFFHNHNTNQFTYRMNSDLDTYNAPKLPASVLDGDDPNLLSSGIIDIKDNKVLIEIGDKPYLLYRKLRTGEDAGTPVGGWCSGGDGDRKHYIARFEALNEVPTRVASIDEAKELVKDPVGMVPLCTQWWVEKMPYDFIPPALEEKHRKSLSTTLNALDYGYKLEECNITDTSYGASTIGMLLPTAKLLEAPYDQRAREYLAAKKAWVAATDAVKSRTPMEYKGVTTQKSRYVYGNAHTLNTRVGFIIKTEEGVYVKGKFSSKDNWEDQSRLESWHKLHSPINRIKLG